MSNVLDVKASELVKAASLQLKDKMKKPAYIEYVKSGANTERPPISPDFWYVRSASILRQVYLNGPIGVSKLRVRYGSRKDHSMHRRHHVDAGGSIIRDAFQALETLKFVQKTKKGRVITPQGKSFLDKISSEIAKRSA
jgi:small subunit ribosomal protein S19e